MLLVFGLSAGAQEFSLDADKMTNAFKAPSYSPYAGRAFPTRLLRGDTHVHTNLSLDPRAAGVILGADGGDRGNWLEALQVSQRLEAERSRIAQAQIAQDATKQSAQSGTDDLADTAGQYEWDTEQTSY